MSYDKAMKTETHTNVSTRVQTFTFDNGELTFSVDMERVEQGMDSELIASLVGVALKTLIHRTSSRPKGQGEDATEWLLDALQGSGASGRFRVTSEDKDRAATAMKGYKMAPEQTEEQFADRYGITFQNDAEWLAKHYMGVRAAMAKAAKEAKSMI